MTTKVHRPAVPGLALILGALTALGPLSIDLYLPALPDLSRELATAASSVQLTLTACLIGLALGQAIAGPCSDRFGRRRPLLIGVSSYALAALLCTVAPSVELLIAARLIQGLAGGAAIVIARAIVRDLHEGARAARLFSTLMQISGVAPILAPLAGGLLLKATSWRGLFLVMAGLSVVLVVAVVRLPETNPGRGDTPMLRTLLRVSAAPTFAGYALVGGLSFAAMFAYIAGSPFVLCEIYGLSPTAFSVVFAVNGLGIIVAGRVANSIQRWSSRTVLAFGVVISVVGGVLAAVAVFANVGLPLLLSGFFLVVASIGVIMPNTVSLALSTVPAAAAGSASALLGLAQFVLGGMIAPMVGIAGPHDARPLVCALVILPCCAALVLARWTGVGGRASGANTVAAAR
ncbi:multidrug effflux MFS transporter [Nocardia huaxiensis]|uniref:multidrug effflux MFS transporter n=1 Tax=Nocardia huaxiensis TaxID=2755382 RepID=UPI001E2DE6AB|nr:multidrug effflux MFS transporter [Nocardia huaxiensis]UFS96072.1 multidrug effflux MFS transporter [Nocardia huaxiensis]